MTLHYSVDTLPELFLSDEFISDRNTYLQTCDTTTIQEYLDSIKINKNYYRTGFRVINPKYKKKVSEDTFIIKSFKTSLNKISSLNYLQICPTLVAEIKEKKHLYPLIIETICEQVLLHHSYCKYYSYLVELLHKEFTNIVVIEKQLDTTYRFITQVANTSSSDYSNLCSKNKQVDQLIGYSIFISELEVRGIIHDRIDISVTTILEEMSSELSEDELYKCVMCISNIFKVIYDDKPIKEEYISILQEIKNSIKFMKIKFTIMDILERR